MRLPRGQGFVLVLFLAGALVGVMALSVGLGRWGSGVGWALLVVAGLLVGAAMFHWLRRSGHPQEP